MTNGEAQHAQDLPLLEQAQLFASADVVISPHGAALSHVVFCHNAAVIELVSPNYSTPAFYLMATLMGLDYHSILTLDKPLSEEQKAAAGRSALQAADMIADVERVEECLEYLLGV